MSGNAAEMKEIHVLDRRVRLKQADAGLRTSLDSVMLAAACPAVGGLSVLDAGCGVGSAGLCLAYRVQGITLTGIDIDEGCIKLASENADANKYGKICSFDLADIRDYADREGERRFDHVICNPPYLEAGSYMASPDEKRAQALGHTDPELDIAVWIRQSHRLLKSGGGITLIYRADGLGKIMRALGKRFGAQEVIPLWPRVGESARRVIVRAIKDRKTPVTLHPGLILHEEDGHYTREAEAVLRHARGLYV